MRTRTAGLISAAMITVASVVGCSAARATATSSIVATAAYVQVPSSPGKSTVGYFDIRNNGSASDQLLSVTTSVGGTVELRAPENANVSPLVMHTVPEISVPAGTMVQLVPNSYHLLITGARPLVDGKDITLSLKFARAGTVTILALVTNPNNGGGSYFLN
jgi:copper(I)-binding protein